MTQRYQGAAASVPLLSLIEAIDFAGIEETLRLGASETGDGGGLWIVYLISGRAICDTSASRFSLRRGEAACLPADGSAALQSAGDAAPAGYALLCRFTSGESAADDGIRFEAVDDWKEESRAAHSLPSALLERPLPLRPIGRWEGLLRDLWSTAPAPSAPAALARFAPAPAAATPAPLARFAPAPAAATPALARFVPAPYSSAPPASALSASTSPVSASSASPPARERLRRFLLLQQLLYALLEQEAETEPETEGARRDDAEAERIGSLQAVERSIASLHERYTESITVIELARRASLSVRQYTRLFKQLTGVTPGRYISDYRIKRSQEQLLLTDEPLERISRSIGIKDVHYFNRLFKQRTGTTPKGYVRARGSASRIVTMHYVGEILALGLRPLGALDRTLEQCRGPIEGIVSIGGDKVELDRLAALQPELILASDFMSREELQAMSRLAPVIVVPWDERPEERLQQIGRILGREREAGEWIDSYTRRKQAAARRSASLLPPGGATAAVLRIDEGKVWVHASRFFPTFYEVICFRPSLLMEQELELSAETRRVAVTGEELERAAADRLYIIVNPDASFGGWLDALRASPSWTRLEEAAKGGVYYLRMQGIAYDACTLQWQLDQIDELLGPPEACSDSVWLCEAPS